MSWIQTEIAHLTKLFGKWQDRAVTAIKQLETDAEPLFKQIQHELTDDAYTIAKTELNAVLSAALSGGGIAAIGGAIAATIPELLTKLELAGNTAAKNALYGIAAIVQADITSKA
jgi:hypothetical protein